MALLSLRAQVRGGRDADRREHVAGEAAPAEAVQPRLLSHAHQHRVIWKRYERGVDRRASRAGFERGLRRVSLQAHDLQLAARCCLARL